MSWGEPVSDKQADLIRKLYVEIDPDLGARRAETFLAEKPTRKEASAKIDRLIEESKKAKAARAAAAPIAPAPVAAAAAAPAPAVRRPDLVFPEDGYYAVEYAGVLRFYRVKHGRGWKEKYQYLDRFKSDELMTIRYDEKAAVLALINADPEKAGMRFAVELTRCRCCGRMLTDEDSRLRGEGPDCWGRKQAIRDELGVKMLGDA